MEHVVFYPSADGVPALTPVPVSLRAYYHVEISPEASTPSGPETVAAPVQATDEDRSAEWIAEAIVHEPAAPEPATAAADAPFAEAPRVTSPDDESTFDDALVHDAAAEVNDPSTVANAEIVPVPTGRRSMGFFTR
jgi:hypothetical protein